MDSYILRCTERIVSSQNIYAGRGGIFLDRDGTIIEEKNYLSEISDLKLLDGVSSGLRKLKNLGMPMYLITNQAGIAHGFFDEKQLESISTFLIFRLRKLRINLRGVFYCPHHPQAKIPEYRHDCYGRKPNPGLLYQAARFDKLNLKHSYIIGDKITDLESGRRVGTRTILVLTGYGKEELKKIEPQQTPDFIAPGINEAADWIIRLENRYNLNPRY